MKTIVYYYSHKGNNRYLANKIAKDLNCTIEEIKPRLNSHLLMLLGLNFGNRKLTNDIENLSYSKYERIYNDHDSNYNEKITYYATHCRDSCFWVYRR